MDEVANENTFILFHYLLLSLHLKSKWYIQAGKWKAERYYSFHKRSLHT